MDNLVNVNKQLNDAENRTKAELQSLRDLSVKHSLDFCDLAKAVMPMQKITRLTATLISLQLVDQDSAQYRDAEQMY